MPYAAYNKIAQDYFEGSIEITEAQYMEALEGLTSGRHVVIDGGFAVIDPPQPTPVEPTPEDIELSKKWELQALSQLAANQKSALTNRIGVINDAIEFDEATPAEIAELPQRNTQLTAWKRYAVLLGRVTTQPGWYETIEWPVQPTEGMDLSVDPVGRAS